MGTIQQTHPLKVLVTGGAGFIGSALVRQLIEGSPHSVLNLDKLTYAGTLTSVEPFSNSNRYQFVQGDICNSKLVADLFATFDPDVVCNLAAECHVDRSIDGPAAFFETNTIGTYTLLQAALKHWRGLSIERKATFRFHHVSTNEVFGSLGDEGLHTETSAYNPRSPYSASKAGADHLVRAWYHTYGLPILITSSSNNYGAYQFPEKLIPLVISKALDGTAIPVFGQGVNVRDWLCVMDHARALQIVFEKGQPGEMYNIGGNAERRNIEVVLKLCTLLDEMRPRNDGRPYADQITYSVGDCPEHDLRQAIDANKLKRELGWEPKESFDSGIRRTVTWYLENAEWWRERQVRQRHYSRERIWLAAHH